MSIRCRFGLLLAIAGCAFAQERLTDLLPAGVVSVTGFSVAPALASPFGRQLLLQVQEEEPQLQRFFTDAGIDPRRDLRDIVFATYSGDQSVVMLRGNFEAAKVKSQLLKSGPPTEFLGVELWKADSRNQRVALLGNTLAIAGDDAAVRRSLELRRPGASHLPEILAQRMQQLASRYDAWIYTADPGSTFSSRVDDSLLEAIRRYAPYFHDVTQVSGGMKFGALVTIDGLASMRSDRDAAGAADMLRLLSGLARITPEKLPNAEFMALFDGMQVRTETNALKLSFSIPQDRLMRLFDSSTKPVVKAQLIPH